jgi:hypothetical protein
VLRDIRENKLFFSLVTTGLFLSFAFNIFGAVSPEGFGLDFKDSEALVNNQIMCKGKLFANQLVAIKSELGPGTSSSVTDCSSQNLMPYSSHFGLQGKFLSAIYNGVDLVFGSFGSKMYIALAQLLMALASATLFAVFTLWVKQKYGQFSAVFVALCVALSPMLVGFGRNLYWALPLMVVPLILSLYYYKRDRRGVERVVFWAIISLSLYLRYLTGYEYVTTFTIMVFAVIAYKLYLEQAHLKDYVKNAGVVLGVSLIAFVAAMTTHIVSLASYTGSTEASIRVIANRAQERTISAEGYTVYPYQNLTRTAPGLQSAISAYGDYEKLAHSGSLLAAVIVNSIVYLLIPVVNIPVEFNQSLGVYLQSTLVFLIILAALYATRKKWTLHTELRGVEALYVGLALGIIGYASWFVLGFSHSLVHAHINGILLYLPTALFGFIILALFSKRSIKKIMAKSD